MPQVNHLARSALGTIAIICLIGLVGCQQDVKTIWSAQSLSPDKSWEASATSEQHGGPGTAGVITTVRLKRVGNSQTPVDVLVFEQSGNRPIDLRMKWIDPTHFDVSYRNAGLDFQAVRCAGIIISTQEAST
jgi:hypothetical protein